MYPAIFRLLTVFFQDNSLTPLKTSLKKMLASFICLLLVNAGIGCWQHVAAQPHVLQNQLQQPLSRQQHHAGTPLMACHQTLALKHSGALEYSVGLKQVAASSDAHHGSMPQDLFKKNQQAISSPDPISASSTTTHAVSHHHCALTCSLYTPPADLAQYTVAHSTLLPANRPFYLIANPLQAWLRDLERPPQFLS